MRSATRGSKHRYSISELLGGGSEHSCKKMTTTCSSKKREGGNKRAIYVFINYFRKKGTNLSYLYNLLRTTQQREARTGSPSNKGGGGRDAEMGSDKKEAVGRRTGKKITR